MEDLAIFPLPLPSAAANVPTTMVAKQLKMVVHSVTVELAIFLLLLLNVVLIALTTLIVLQQQMDVSCAAIKLAVALVILFVEIHVLLMLIARTPEMVVRIVITDFVRQPHLMGDVVFSAVALLVAMEQ